MQFFKNLKYHGIDPNYDLPKNKKMEISRN